MTVTIPFQYNAVQVPPDPTTWDTILAPTLGIPSFEAAGLVLSQKEGKLHLWDEYSNCATSAIPGDWILVRTRPSGTKGIVVMSNERFAQYKVGADDERADSVLDE